MVRIVSEFRPELATLLPETHDLLRAAHVTLHDAVCQVTLLGSRGLAGNYHAASDIDLSLMVDVNKLPPTEPERGITLRSVLETALNAWKAPVDVECVVLISECGRTISLMGVVKIVSAFIRLSAVLMAM